MKTTLDLPDDLMEEIQTRAARERKTATDFVADLLRQGLDAAAATGSTVVKADKAMLKRRKELTQKFVTGEWGLMSTTHKPVLSGARTGRVYGF